MQQIELLQEKIQAEYDQLRKINSGVLLDEQELWHIKVNAEIDPITLVEGNLEKETSISQPNDNCDYKKLVDECFALEEVDAYEVCSANAGCTVGATRRPMYDKMSFRRKQ